MQARREWMVKDRTIELSIFQRAEPPLEEVSRRPSKRAAFQPTRAEPCGLPAPRRARPWPPKAYRMERRRSRPRAESRPSFSGRTAAGGVSRQPSKRAAFQPTCAEPCGLPAPRRASPCPRRRICSSATRGHSLGTVVDLIRSPVTSGSCPSQAMMKHSRLAGVDVSEWQRTERPQRLRRRGGRTRRSMRTGRAYNGVG
jgi:hypothetical protein